MFEKIVAEEFGTIEQAVVEVTFFVRQMVKNLVDRAKRLSYMPEDSAERNPHLYNNEDCDD